jgi:MFS family permease
MNTGFGVAGMVSPVVFGFLIEKTGSYNVPFTISAGLLAVGIVAALFIDTSKTVEADEQREIEEGLPLDGIPHDGVPAFLHAGPAVRLERHHLRRPLRWRK